MLLMQIIIGGGNLKRYFFRSSRQIVFESEESYNSIIRDETTINNTPKKWRMLTPTECEVLQTLPKGYTNGVKDIHRYKVIGNGWTVDVITHILKNMKDLPQPKSRQLDVLIPWYEVDN